MSRRIRRTPYTSCVEKSGISGFTVVNHTLLPKAFQHTTIEDYYHLRENVQIWDVGCQRQVQIKGPDSAFLVQKITPRDLRSTVIGECLYVPLINNDGKISKKEIEKQRDFMVQSMDLNGDKMVSTQELIKRHAKRADFFAKRMIKKLDSNGDGSLSFSELKKSQQWKLERMFYRLDKNNDGFISKEEAQTARKNMLKR